MRIAFASHAQWWSMQGGTEHFSAELVAHLGGLHDFYTITRPADREFVVTPHPERGIGVEHTYHAEQTAPRNAIGAFSDQVFELYIQLLSDLAPDVLHVQHTMNVGVELIHAANVIELPVLLSFHDYFAACPSYALLNAEDRFCHLPEDFSVCNRCLHTKFQVGTPTLPMMESWRATTRSVMPQVDMVHFPSDAARDILVSAYPRLHTKTSVVLPTYFPGQTDHLSPIRADTATLAVLGAHATHKGAALVTQVIPTLLNEGLHVVFIGSRPEEWALAPAVSALCKSTGPFRRGDAVRLLNESGAHAVLLASLWPETYMRTLSETWEAGIPAFVLDRGAQAARVRQNGGGFVLVGDTPDAVSAQILDAFRSRAVANMSVPKLPSSRWLSDEYAALYNRVVESHRPAVLPLSDAEAQIVAVSGQAAGAVQARLRDEAINDGVTVARSWNGEAPTLDKVDSFYQTTDSYLYDLEIASRLRTRRVWRQRVMSLIYGANLEDMPILDLGCGNGVDAIYYLNHGLQVTAFDLPSQHLSLAKHRAQCAGSEAKITFIDGDADRLTAGMFGAVTCFEVLEHVSNPPKLIEQIAAALALGGVALLTESFALVGDKYPSHLPENEQYVGRLDELCGAVGLVRAGLLCGRIHVFRKGSASTGLSYQGHP
ncbi:MAG: methyltransferase domain-containing protein [Actinomycetota bacterium]|nr:methyltransferase domain-containing protein [Actinomycetota bacterium]